MSPAIEFGGLSTKVPPRPIYEWYKVGFARARGTPKELAVARKYVRKDDKRVTIPPKRYWHLYSLQALQSDKLIRIINKVLRHEFLLIK